MAVHVATWRVNNETAECGYHPQTSTSISTDKVSLDHYRRESKKILAIFREHCPKVEKASIDESFLDLSGMIYDRLIERYKDELGVVDGVPIAPYADVTEKLRLPEVAEVEWNDSHLIDLDEGDLAEEDPIDWDDIAMGIGAEIVLGLRKQIKARLNYTCSAGIAKNKMLAKLGSGYQKPDQQTIVRNRAVANFLGNMKFTKIRNLGGKLGENVTAKFETELLSELLPVPLETLKKKLDDDTGTWLYHTIRGIDRSEVNTRTDIKSMLSAKSFKTDITSIREGENWLKVFIADIVSRINEMSDEPDDLDSSQPVSLRRPKSMTLHHRHGSSNKTRQAAIPLGKPIDEDFLLPIAKTLLRQIEAEGRCWPCQNLSLAVSGFDDVGRGTNRGIGGWLVRGDEAKFVIEENMKRTHAIEDIEFQPKKHQKTAVDGANIKNFFGNQQRKDNDKTQSHEEQKQGKEPKPVLYPSALSPPHDDTDYGEFDDFDDDDDELYKLPSQLHRLDSKGSTHTEPDDLPKTSSDPPIGKLRVSKSETPPGTRGDSLPPRSKRRFFNGISGPTASNEASPAPEAEAEPSNPIATEKNDEEAFPCPECNNKLVPMSEIDEHSDWHFAKSLMDDERKSQANTTQQPQQQQPPLHNPPVKPTAERGGRGRGRGARGGGSLSRATGVDTKMEKGQMKLPFAR